MLITVVGFNALGNRLVRTVQRIPDYCRFWISDFGNKV
jgi:hypothetical protein